MKHVNEVRYSKDARNFIKKAEPKLKLSLQQAIESLKTIPAEGDIKPMEGYKDGRMRLRVGKYRVIFRYSEDNTLLILYIIDIGSRGDIYK